MQKTRRWLAALLALALVVPAVPAFAAPQQTTVTGKSMMHFIVDGVEYAPPEGEDGFIYKGGYTYVPLRFVAYILGKDVNWDGTGKRVSIFDPKTEEARMKIEAYKEERKVENSVIEPVTTARQDVLTIDVVPEVGYSIYGNSVQPDENAPGLMVNNRIYVPLRFVSENLGYKVTWDRTTFSITIGIAEVDRIVASYREKAEEIKGDTIEEARAILRELGLNELDVLRKNVSEEKMEELRKIASEWLPEVEQQLEDFISAMTKELTDAGQPTLLADQLRKELENLINLAKNLLGI